MMNDKFLDREDRVVNVYSVAGVAFLATKVGIL